LALKVRAGWLNNTTTDLMVTSDLDKSRLRELIEGQTKGQGEFNLLVVAEKPQKTSDGRLVYSVEDVVGRMRKAAETNATLSNALEKAVAAKNQGLSLFTPVAADWRVGETYRDVVQLLQIIGSMAIKIATKEFDETVRQAELVGQQA
jgi:hypothetical protein